MPKNLQGPLFPALCLKNAEAWVNFGGSAFTHKTVPGYVPLAKAQAEHISLRVADSVDNAQKGGRKQGGSGRKTPLVRSLATAAAAAALALALALVLVLMRSKCAQ